MKEWNESSAHNIKEETTVYETIKGNSIYKLVGFFFYF